MVPEASYVCFIAEWSIEWFPADVVDVSSPPSPDCVLPRSISTFATSMGGVLLQDTSMSARLLEEARWRLFLH